MNKNLFIKIAIGLFLIAGVPGSVSAARVFFSSPSSAWAVGGEYLVEAYIDTEGESLNAVEGSLTLPGDLLDVVEVRDGNSAINFWVERPKSGDDGYVKFSGITPGGLTGGKKFLLAILVRPAKEGEGLVGMSEAKALMNDGLGSSAEVSIEGLPFAVFGVADTASGEVSPEDREAPETFQPFIGRDPEIFEGKYFIVFSTVDKGSGIQKYEIKEGLLGEYVEAESPYVLQDQSLRSNLFVKAIDKAGNARIIKVSPLNGDLWLELAIVLAIILIFIAWRIKKWRRSGEQ